MQQNTCVYLLPQPLCLILSCIVSLCVHTNANTVSAVLHHDVDKITVLESMQRLSAIMT